MIIAPINFAQISPGVYRSGYPNKKNFSFLQKLKLKCVLYIGTLPKKDDDLTFHRANLEFYEKEGIRFLHLDVGENREPFLQMNHKVVSQVVKLLLGTFSFFFLRFSSLSVPKRVLRSDTKNHPILMHCLRGKIPCSCVVGCYRKVQKWSLTSVFDEYERFVGSLRSLDTQFLELFDVSDTVVTSQESTKEVAFRK